MQNMKDVKKPEGKAEESGKRKFGKRVSDNTTEEIRIRLRSSVGEMSLPDAGEGLSRLLRMAREETAGSQRRERLSFWRFFIIQGKYLGWKIWATQFCCLFFITALVPHILGTNFLSIPTYTVKYLCAFSCFIFLSGVPFLGRAGRYKMYELESAAYFSPKRLLAVKLLWMGAGNVCMLAGLFIFMTRFASLESVRTAVCLVLPFLLTAAVCLYFLSHMSADRFPAACALFCGAVFLCIMVWSERQPYLYPEHVFPVGLLALAAGLALLCIYQLWFLLNRSDYEELQLV